MFDKSKRINMNIARQSPTCKLCGNEPHDVTSCSVFITWSPYEKWNSVKQNKLCFQCLQPDHRRETCTQPKYKFCDKPHHCLLHKDFRNNIPMSNGVAGLNRDSTVISQVGRLPNSNCSNYECGIFNTWQISFDDEEALVKIVETALAGIEKECACKEKTDEELLFDSSMRDAWSIDETGRFQVKLPWKFVRSNLRNNRIQAVNRSISLQKRLAKDPNLLKLFDDQMDEMISSNILRKVAPDVPQRYLPVLAVVNPEKKSTKLRVCLNSKAKFSGLSLNDALLKGKMKMNDIFETVLRFRCRKYTLVGDVRKMFWQIRIDAEDEKYHGVIYKGNTYVFTHVCFGNKPSPPITNMSMLKMAQYGKETHPLAAKALVNDRYMYDIAEAKSDVRVLVQIRNEVTDLIGRFGFEIKEWLTKNYMNYMNYMNR